MVVSDNVVSPPNSTKTVFSYKTYNKPCVFESGFYSFLGEPSMQCRVVFFINGKPNTLWRDQPVFLRENIPKNCSLEVKVINSSADTHLLSINLHINEN